MAAAHSGSVYPPVCDSLKQRSSCGRDTASWSQNLWSVYISRKFWYEKTTPALEAAPGLTVELCCWVLLNQNIQFGSLFSVTVLVSFSLNVFPELPQKNVPQEEVLADQEKTCSLDQEEPEPTQIKEEWVEVQISDDVRQVVLKQEVESLRADGSNRNQLHSLKLLTMGEYHQDVLNEDMRFYKSACYRCWLIKVLQCMKIDEDEVFNLWFLIQMEFCSALTGPTNTKNPVSDTWALKVGPTVATCIRGSEDPQLQDEPGTEECWSIRGNSGIHVGNPAGRFMQKLGWESDPGKLDQVLKASLRGHSLPPGQENLETPCRANLQCEEPQTCPAGPEVDTEQIGATDIQRPPRAQEPQEDHHRDYCTIPREEQRRGQGEPPCSNSVEAPESCRYTSHWQGV
ncbi:hypothetical protein CRENBAI_025030 [Crenichthys baileyi]|uniref:Uncharacterized protein n=1 Tax=Crenichthys baileyi TaxID=28760 RepID=A0AAV9RC66_9TELE